MCLTNIVEFFCLVKFDRSNEIKKLEHIEIYNYLIRWIVIIFSNATESFEYSKHFYFVNFSFIVYLERLTNPLNFPSTSIWWVRVIRLICLVCLNFFCIIYCIIRLIKLIRLNKIRT